MMIVIVLGGTQAPDSIIDKNEDKIVRDLKEGDYGYVWVTSRNLIIDADKNMYFSQSFAVQNERPFIMIRNDTQKKLVEEYFYIKKLTDSIELTYYYTSKQRKWKICHHICETFVIPVSKFTMKKINNE